MQFKRTALTAACVAAIVALANAATPQGPWHGRLSVGLQRLNIVFHFNADGTCTLDSPDQGATGIVAELLPCGPDSVVAAVPSLHAEFRGRVGASTIAGKFRQGPYTFPLTLKPGTVDVRRPQTPRPPYPYAVEDVEIDAGDAVLSATLVCPERFDSLRDVPLVVLVSGSGLQNRDEEILQHRPFAVIADFLARRGIASLRYDDRGFARSTGSNDSATTLTYAADAEAAVAYARSLGRFGRVGVLGHSEGGTIGFILGSRGAADFVVSMAGAAERGLDILMRQNRRALREAGTSDAEADAYCAALAAVLDGREADTSALSPALAANLARVRDSRSPWLRHFAAYAPAAAIAATRCPVLAINGTRDTQVDAEANLGIIRRMLPDGAHNTVRAYDGLNHLMQHCATGSVAEYGSIEETIAPEVLADIVAWLSQPR